MPAVACGAVTVQDRFVGKRFQKFCLGIGVAREAELVTPLSGHGRIIRSVGVVAGLAFTTLEGVMDRLVFQGVHRLGMTAGAEIGSLLVDQSLELCRMRLVAREASRSAIHRRMLE